jgi:hypothetical protein
VVIEREQAQYPQMGYKSYIICTSPRSGSTLLCQLLANTNVAGVPNSYFHKPSLTSWMEVHDIAANNFPNRSGTLQAIFEKVRKVGIAETGVFGLRLQGGSINYFLDQLKFCIRNNTAMWTDKTQPSGKLRSFFCRAKTNWNRPFHALKPCKRGFGIQPQTGLNSNVWHHHSSPTLIEKRSDNIFQSLRRMTKGGSTSLQQKASNLCAYLTRN